MNANPSDDSDVLPLEQFSKLREHKPEAQAKDSFACASGLCGRGHAFRKIALAMISVR
jgi:hypothetical protein